MNILEIINKLRENNVFPSVVGGQLKLAGETKRLSEDFIEQIRCSKNELIEFLKGPAEQRFSEPILKVTQQEAYPCSNAQNRIWTLSHFDGGGEAYNIVTSLLLKGAVVTENLSKAFQNSIERHESLRTTFKNILGVPHQIIFDYLPFDINYRDVTQIEDVRDFLIYQVEESTKWKFDLENGPLMKVDLYKLDKEEFAMIFGVHHIISDGWSVNILIKEVISCYEALCNGTPFYLEPLKINYKDYSHWLSNIIDGEAAKESKDFWKKELGENLMPLNLPSDFPRSQVRNYEGAVSKFYFEGNLYRRIGQYCQNSHVTIFNFFRATISLLLGKISGQNEVIIGVPVSGRNHFDLENQIGLFVNTLPLQAYVNPDNSFYTFLQEISENSFKIFQYQDYPLDKIIQDLEVKRDPGRNPLFDVMMVLQDTALGNREFNQNHQSGFELNYLDSFIYKPGQIKNERRPAKCDLTFNFDSEPGNKHFLEIEYSTQLFKEDTILKFFNCYEHIVNQVLDNPLVKISSIQIVDNVGRHKILNGFNQPINDIEEHSILGLMEKSFEVNKDRPAIFFGEKVISYTELDYYSNVVSNYLTSLDSLQPNSLIGLLLSRSEWTIITVLGILKAGMTYVPLDVLHPGERITYILNDAHLQFLIVDDDGLKLLSQAFTGSVVHINEFREADMNGTNKSLLKNDLRENLAYIIYTSGSTGFPKGVEITHRNTIAFLKWSAEEFKTTPFEIMYATTSYCFDLSVFEFLFPLCKGKSIRLLESALQIPDHISKDNGVMVNTVPSVVRNLLEMGINWSNVTALNMAGETIPNGMREDLQFLKAEIRNLYGPTEDTTYSTVYKFDEKQYQSVPIGKPIHFSHLYILDSYQNIVPEGIIGEIYLGGHGVAKGYLNNPELTKEKFISNPFVPGMSMYRTGDFGKWLEDGNVEFLGRKDDQVKIRGNRIELGEIQYFMEQHPQITQAVIIAEKDKESKILAYYVGDLLLQSSLKDYLADRIPAYMIPDCFILLNKMPLNSNGKIDRSQLPKPVVVKRVAIKEPQNDLQNQILLIWKEVLDQDHFGIDENFFDLGGHSLKATKLKYFVSTRLQKELSLNEIFSTPTVEKQALLIESKEKKMPFFLSKAPEGLHYPISYSQERLWVLTNFEEASRAYNMPAAFEITGDLNRELLEQAFWTAIESHEILRTVFAENGNNLVQIILPISKINFSIDEIVIESDFSLPQLNSFLQQKWSSVFDLKTGPLLYAFVIHTPNRKILSFNMHHMISDGWSLEVLYKHIITTYSKLYNKTFVKLNQLQFQYKDYTVWQRSALNDESLKNALSFWTKMFGDNIPVLELPYDFYRPDIKSYNGDTFNYQFTPTLSYKINLLAKKSEVSLFMVLMAAVNVLLKKYSNQNQIVIGTPVAGREFGQMENQIGLYVNTIAIKSILDGKNTFSNFLGQQKALILECFEHQNFPFEMLIEELKIKRDLSRSPLFDVMVVLQNISDLNGEKELSPDVKMKRLVIPSKVAKYDCTFSFEEKDGSLSLELEYNSDLFIPRTIEQLIKHFERLLEQVVDNPYIEIKDIALLSNEEYQILTSKADQTDIKFNKSATIVNLFQKAAYDYPGNIAISSEGKYLTYRELDKMSSQLSHVLIHYYGVLNEDLICLYFERNEWMIVGILAVLKAGAAYVPIDPSYPSNRVDYILNDTQTQLVLHDSDSSNITIKKQNTIKFLNIETEKYTGKGNVAEIHPQNLAYVIYTSGTTGNPKGVLIEHTNVCRLLFNSENPYDFSSSDRWPLFHSYCFDVSVWEMYGALLNGGTLIIVPKETAQDSLKFYEFLINEKITVFNQTPTAFRSLVQNNKVRFYDNPPGTIRYLIFAGEALKPEILKEWREGLPACTIVNMYGITETTVHVTYKEITSKEIEDNKSIIGAPLPTLSCYVLDIDLQQVPIGVIGELCVGGHGLSRGYLNKPELTAQKFIDHPNLLGTKLYRSGDFARILFSGEIEYVGRKDDQVKIRGHRIEISEIETVITRQKGIKDAVVIPVKNSNDDYELVAYYILENELDIENLRSTLSDYLPSYMVPSYLILLTYFPLNRNGKLDKSALPKPDHAYGRKDEFLPPRNDTDQVIISIWEDILEAQHIGITDNFFDLGGHSLKATRVIAKIHEIYGIKIDLKDLFKDPTIQNLSNYIETIQWMGNQQEVITKSEDEIIF